MNTIILFDLEETLIDDWSLRNLLHEDNIHLQPWINQQGTFRTGLLSFAVWDDNDVEVFNKELRGCLEHTFNITFDDQLIFTKNILLEHIRVWDKKPFLSACDFDDFFNKRQMIEMVWLHMFQQPNTHLMLLDDTVPDVHMTSLNVPECHLTMVNPKNLDKR